MDAHVRTLIESLHRSPIQVALVVTGGGAGAIAQLLAVPGGSRTVLEAVVPYNEQALCDYLGFRPDQFCSIETAAAMAERALDRARQLAAEGGVLIGLSCTASLATDRPKRGDHRFFIGRASEDGTDVVSTVLQKDTRTREEEEALLDAAMLNFLAETAGIAERLSLPFQSGEETRFLRETGFLGPRGESLLSALYHNREQRLCIDIDGRITKTGTLPKLILPGAFNPLHDGHKLLAETAARLTGLEPAFELSILNVDKPPLAVQEIRRRANQFRWLAPLWLTRAPRFLEKAALFPGALFVVGVDTAARIVDAQYYGENPAAMTEALQQVKAHGCRFLVAGRKDAAGGFRQLGDIAVPAPFLDLFSEIPESEFHSDISSTELRGGK